MMLRHHPEKMKIVFPEWPYIKSIWLGLVRGRVDRNIKPPADLIVSADGFMQPLGVPPLIKP
jgi:hypothetical protein